MPFVFKVDHSLYREKKTLFTHSKMAVMYSCDKDGVYDSIM